MAVGSQLMVPSPGEMRPCPQAAQRGLTQWTGLGGLLDGWGCACAGEGDTGPCPAPPTPPHMMGKF